jgi:hypothetical protein
VARKTLTKEQAQRVREHAQRGIDTIREHSSDAHFCVGAAWATLGAILQEFGEQYPTAPWSQKP